MQVLLGEYKFINFVFPDFIYTRMQKYNVCWDKTESMFQYIALCSIRLVKYVKQNKVYIFILLYRAYTRDQFQWRLYIAFAII